MIKIDFHAGTHGHFLEYVTNVFIMLTDPGYISPFTPGVGNSHNTDDIYQQNKIVRCGHFSTNAGGHFADPKYRDHKFHYSDTIVRINIDQSDDRLFFIALTNLLYRAGYSQTYAMILSYTGKISFLRLMNVSCIVTNSPNSKNLIFPLLTFQLIISFHFTNSLTR